MRQLSSLWILGRLALLAMMSGLVGVTPVSAQFSVYYQQGAHVRLNGHEIPAVYFDGHDAEIREDRPQENFNGGSGGLNGVEGPNSIAIISSNDPAGTDQATAYLLRFDEIFTEKYAPIPPGSHIESAWLVLDFEKAGSVPRLFRCEVPWDAATVNWNNLGSPGNGIEVGSDAQFLRDIHPPLPRIAIEVTPEIIEWYRDPDAVNGWAVLPGGSDPLRLKTNHFRDPEQILGGIPAFVPGGLWGIRVNGTALQLTDPQLLNEGAFGPPALIVYFSIPENQPPPVFDEEEPPPGGGNGGDGGGGFPSEANRLQMAGHPKKEAVIRWRDWPDRKQKLVAKNDLEDGEWTDTVPVDEVGPGRFEGRETTDGRSTRFYRVQQLDEDGDGQADRSGGATNAAGERCPENVLSELFKHIERTGRRLQDADDEFNRNAIVEEIRTAQLLWEFAKRYASGVYAVPFDRSVRGFLSGKKELKPILPDGRLGVGILNPQHAAQILRDTIEYLRLMFWWRLVYDNSLNDLKRQEIRNFIDDLNNRLAQLNALNPANAGFANQLRTLQQQICNLFDSARIQPESAVGELITKLMVWLAQEGITGLIKIMLADTFGKGFINGTLEGVAAAA
ncbi:MAG: hypothetical protein LR011_10380, partial [Verrucomicrobia bacterium]|nr:hypothetical protein [Verrucomicrobiota bacterium]